MKLSDFKRKFFKQRTRRQWFDLLADGFVRYRHFAGRGNSLTNEFKGLIEMFAYGGLIMLVVEKATGIIVPLQYLPSLWVLQKVAELLLAIWDKKKLKLWQRETAWAQRNINPIEQEKMKHLRGLSKLVQIVWLLVKRIFQSLQQQTTEIQALRKDVKEITEEIKKKL